MDWVQRQPNERGWFSVSPSFNPCCRGLGSKTRLCRHHVFPVLQFQSLLSWIGFKDLGIVFSRLGRLSEFQSLLSWIGFKDLKSIPQTVPGSSCFNPCCRGLGSKTCRPHRSRQPGPCVSILVVVDWVQRLRPGDSALRCGSGFQSLLSWIGFKDILQTLLMSGQILVSILVVVDWVQRPRRLCG